MNNVNKASEVRYYFEHRLLRDFYFDSPECFAETFLEDQGVLYNVFDNTYRNKGVPNPYREEEFSVNLVSMSDGARAVRLLLPQPEESPLCYRIYAFFGKEFRDAGYFCIESDRNDEVEGLYLCRWLKDGTHIGYGRSIRSIEQEFLECADYFRTFDPDKIKIAVVPLKGEGGKFDKRRNWHDGI